MAVSFTSKDSGKVLLIGGQSTYLGVQGGGIGPFPRYSISREDIKAPDGTYLNTKFSINITGTATLKDDTDQDIIERGERQSAVQGESIIKFQFNRDQFPMHGVGQLEIAPYGGKANQIVFNDAQVTGIELPEQTEESSGIQNLEYSFSFEAYNDESSGQNTGSSEAGAGDPTWLLSSVDDSWDLSINDGEGSFDSNDISSATIKKIYTLTHTVSATGLKKFAEAVGLDTDGEAWRQAVLWVKTRLVDDPGSAIDTDIVGMTATTNFNPFNMDKDGDSDNLGFDLTGGANYKAYNHLRTVSSNTSEGSYSITDTWVVSDNTTNARHDIDISYEDSQEAPAKTISVSGTITGLDTNSSSSNSISRYSNAKSELSATLAKVFSLASAVYTASGGTGSLRNIELTRSIGHNKVAGVITYSLNYDDLSVTIDNALSESVTVSYDNEDGANEIIAIIGVIGKAGGPVIQNMGTTNEKKVTVSVDVVMQRGYRTDKPDGTSLATTYKPTVGFQTTKTESWTPNTGAYNLNIEWIYV